MSELRPLGRAERLRITLAGRPLDESSRPDFGHVGRPADTPETHAAESRTTCLADNLLRRPAFDREAVLDKLVYTATNPVADHLVERAHRWPGINGLSALLNGRPLRATRPLHFFRSDGPMPETLELALTIPAELGPAADVISELRTRVHERELVQAAERQRTGRRVLGRRAVLAQSWRQQPQSCEPRRNLRPRVASPNKWARLEALLRNRTFIEDYADARARWRDGVAATFPAGTYWLQRFASVPILQT